MKDKDQISGILFGCFWILLTADLLLVFRSYRDRLADAQTAIHEQYIATEQMYFFIAHFLIGFCIIQVLKSLDSIRCSVFEAFGWQINKVNTPAERPSRAKRARDD